MAAATTSTTKPTRRNGSFPPEFESFHKFFECWLAEQNQHLHDLISASSPARDANDQALRPLIDRVFRHYDHYYKAKSRCTKQNVLPMFSPAWRSSLEDAFLWIGGWHPSMAFHLLYSKSGFQLEAHLAELLRGLTTGDLADLCPSQLALIDDLQRSTIREEKAITEKFAKHQEMVANVSMVELSHAVTEMNRTAGRQAVAENETAMEEEVESTLAAKEKGLEEILQMADDLRLITLKEILNILCPMQSVHFLIAAAELHLRIHEWGKKKEEAQAQT
ncbi:protein DOG1-like 3 [Syzygium oleosum]|uniref:protein DOG1-like 3 n=1 Tax=Syzygium oleosum TaxID=219896 RepID=UPI0024B9ADFA|nr:protein DOG1-like 3 [Syzygium oleosum]